MLLMVDTDTYRVIDEKLKRNLGLVHNPDPQILLEYYHDFKINGSDMRKRYIITTEEHLKKFDVDEEVLGTLISNGLMFVCLEYNRDVMFHLMKL